MPELKKCPFCGGEAMPNWWAGYAHGECIECGACGEDIWPLEDEPMEETEKRAAEAWNRRANECDRDELLKVADEMYEDTTSFEIKDVPENIPAWVVFKWHERIRKALGVE